MTSAVYGHGFRAEWIALPSCKCGWLGTGCGPGQYDLVESAARTQFEKHKHRIRQELGIEDPAKRPPPGPVRPLLRVVR